MAEADPSAASVAPAVAVVAAVAVEDGAAAARCADCPLLARTAAR